MSFDEFEYLSSTDEYEYDEEKKLILKFEKIISNVELQATQDLIKSCEEYLCHTRNKKIESLKNVLKLSVILYNDGFSEEVKQITLNLWNEIAVKKEWYISELKLLNQILFYFPDHLVFDVVDRIVERLRDYDAFQNMTILKTSILINLSTIYLDHSKFEQCEEIAKWAYRESKKIKRYDFIAISLIRLGICQKDKEMINKGLNIFRLAEENELEKEFQKEITRFDTTLVGQKI